tara:strand:+ start:484 stop:975 length:492 start_codon:yes stop_codon:yes gene_type:complete
MAKNKGFRAWYYFRNGWSMYFAFAFAAINTLVVTYYLAIEKAPILKELFPSFLHYLLIVVAVGVPLLISVGYVHYKKTSAFSNEVAVNFESNPFQRRVLINTEINLQINIKLLELISKLNDNESTENNSLETEKLLKEFQQFISERKFENTRDLEYLQDLYKK